MAEAACLVNLRTKFFWSLWSAKREVCFVRAVGMTVTYWIHVRRTIKFLLYSVQYHYVDIIHYLLNLTQKISDTSLENGLMINNDIISERFTSESK
jgi:hypothetical protein